MKGRKGFVLILVMILSVITAVGAARWFEKTLIVKRLESTFLSGRFLSNECRSLSTAYRKNISTLSLAEQTQAKKNFFTIKIDQKSKWQVSRKAKAGNKIIFVLRSIENSTVSCRNEVIIS